MEVMLPGLGRYLHRPYRGVTGKNLGDETDDCCVGRFGDALVRCFIKSDPVGLSVCPTRPQPFRPSMRIRCVERFYTGIRIPPCLGTRLIFLVGGL